MGLKVAVLAFPLSARVWGGISWATYRLLEAASASFTEDEFHLLFYEPPPSEVGRRYVDRLVGSRSNVSCHDVGKGGPAVSWCEANADVVWGPASGILRTKTVPQVFTHHDMRMFGALKESWRHAMTHRAGLNHAMRHAALAVVPSPSTRREMLEHYRGQRYEAKVDTVPWGVPAGFDEARGIEPLRPESVKGEHFITTIYDPFPHKRMDLLQRTVPQLEAHGWDLVVMGGMRGGGIDVRVDHPRVHYTGFVEHDILPRYIKASSLFLFPSEYEGFGFPPYEAMALGVPVMYNRRCEALASVIGDGTHWFDADEGMVEGLGALMGSGAERRRHVDGALRLVGRFRWDLAARRYMHLLRAAAKAGPDGLDLTAGRPRRAVDAIPD